MEIKSFPATSVKAIDDADAPGTFEAIVAVFGNVDSVGDKILPGAFDDWLANCKTTGYAPIVFSHQWRTVPIGVHLDMKAVDEGLYVKGRLFVADGEDHDIARQVYTAMKATDPFGKSALREFSFAYDILEMAEVKTEEDGWIWELRKLAVIEAGPCLKGANDATRLVGVKADDAAPDGRVRPKTTNPHHGIPSPTPPRGGKDGKARPSNAFVDLMSARPRF